ncbi:MAG: MauE/DoxX family redox-associated membrane protein [Anaerolineaceae bacterium]
MKTKTYILTICTLLLLLLWIPVTLDKFWDLPGFRQTLLRQPFPDAWAEVLFWLLPVLEGLCVVLLVGGTIANPKTNRIKSFRTWGFALSTILMVAFTLFILFGVMGWYEKRPCGCGSVISGLSWNQHLWFNLMFLLVSVVGWWLGMKIGGLADQHAITRPQDKWVFGLVPFWEIRIENYSAAIDLCYRRRFPRRFALFPGRPVGQPRSPSTPWTVWVRHPGWMLGITYDGNPSSKVVAPKSPDPRIGPRLRLRINRNLLNT